MSKAIPGGPMGQQPYGRRIWGEVAPPATWGFYPFVTEPQVGDKLKMGNACATVESRSAAAGVAP
jgi:hypothetical protein